MLPALSINRTLLCAGERVCVAVSGGADSVALLIAMHEAAAELGIGVSAAHIHHGLRGPEADADQAFVVALCAHLQVPVHVLPVDTLARQVAEGEGMEEAARELRYAALRGLMKSGVVDVVATAHTFDDQAETVMMKLLRGAWLEGLAGIAVETPTSGQRPASGRVIRPMLSVRRSAVEAFLRARNQRWCEDASNADVRLTRNRVRHELLPLLRTYNPAADEALAHIAELSRADDAYWRAEVARIRPMLLLPGKPVRGGGRRVGTQTDAASIAIEVERLRGLADALRSRMLREAAATVGVRLTFLETAKVLALALNGKAGKKLELRAGLRVERTARELQMWREG